MSHALRLLREFSSFSAAISISHVVVLVLLVVVMEHCISHELSWGSSAREQLVLGKGLLW